MRVGHARQRTWPQAELAHAVEASPRTVRRLLDELTLSGWPIERDEERPHVW